ncbi:hypothetical protein COY90_01705 [Candidatus Roizmanbacteria bacterium CG_4_10_14_0_8_um_filter_39_9]|uniref:Class I SAM-dependent methyltransferase n=1 Tax=Candidatus Roizmanbacteria bacterium CG_4_10_14_0_8_um_filter_39_9 TaxID=1974829 RepID=A0A2M7QE85_9BACT|nr:MAG: hypothetical protein COY90_01705 [Candidatus Roizmanbacteria bacterium CG_4_10_14_0_8_um_filter_39_9]
MTYLSQLSEGANKLTFVRKQEYIHFNFGQIINNRLKQKNCTILEIGPGLGEFVAYCNERGASSIDIIDSEKTVLDFVSAKYNIRNPILSKDVDSIESKLGNYNIIVMTQVLEHIPKKNHLTYLQILYTHLKKDGVILITVPNIGNPLAIFERYYDYTHETAFTEHSLLQLTDFAQLNKANVRVQAFKIPTYNAINIVRTIFQFFLHGLFKIIFIINGGVYPKILTTNITLIIEKNGK